jgi:hypothetical protein
MLIVLETITIEGTGQMGISAVLTGLALIVLVGIFLLKLINVLKVVDFYDTVHIFSTFALGVICFFFVLLGSLMNLDDTVFTVYLWFSTPVFSIICILWVVEMIMLPVSVVTGRKETRFERKG